MARAIARVTGTAIAPGVSRNGRLYTADMIRAAVERAQSRIFNGGDSLDIVQGDAARPLNQRTHHSAEDDSTRIVGRISALRYDEATGRALFEAELAPTDHGHRILELIDTEGGPAFLRGVSVRGGWVGRVRKVRHGGQLVETADGLELDGLDYTQRPGVPGAGIDTVERLDGGAPRESTTAGARVLIYESVQEAQVETAIEEAVPVPVEKAVRFADNGYRPDGEKRLPLDTAANARAAWAAIHESDTAGRYSVAQLKRMRERTVRALGEHGVEVLRDGTLLHRHDEVTEADEIRECQGCDKTIGSAYLVLSHGPMNLTLSVPHIDPHDLEVVGRAAMEAATSSMASIAGATLPDGPLGDDMVTRRDDMLGRGDDMVTRRDDGVVRPVAMFENDGAAAPHETTSPADEVVEEEGASASTQDDPNTVSTDAEAIREKEEPGVSEPTAAVAETAPAAAAPAAEPTLTLGQVKELFESFAAAVRPAVAEAAPVVAAVAEAAPVEAAPVAEAAPVVAEVVETEAERIERLVQERVGAAVTKAIQETVAQQGPPARRGLAGTVTESVAGPAGEFDYPEGWPQKPLHQYTAEENKRFLRPGLEASIMGRRSVQNAA